MSACSRWNPEGQITFAEYLRMIGRIASPGFAAQAVQTQEDVLAFYVLFGYLCG